MSTVAGQGDAALSWCVDEDERLRRRAAVEKVRARRAGPQHPVTVGATVDIGAPAAAVWAAMTDPTRAAELLEVPPFVACRAPWTPDSAVGELSCVATRMPDGTVRAGAEETLLREEGRRLVSRARTGPFPGTADWTLTPVADDRCTARVVVTVPGPTGTRLLLRHAYGAGLRAALWRLRRAVGDPAVAQEPAPRPPWLERRGRLREARTAARLAVGPRVAVEVTRALVLPVPAGHVWALVRSTGSPAVEHGDPGAVCFTPEGGAPDAVGALRLVLGRDPFGDLELQVEEVVAVVEGGRLKTRDLTAFAPEASVVVTGWGAGCRVDARLTREVLPGAAAATEVGLGRRAEAYLDRLGRAVTGMPPLPLEEAWVG